MADSVRDKASMRSGRLIGVGAGAPQVVGKGAV
jgi:hypothetical protein